MDELIDRILADARKDPSAWSRDGWSRAADATRDCAAEFLAWARDHKRWSFIVAESNEVVCAKPPEAAAWVLHEIIEELLED